jgi:NTP pyrophosphatase (non-canonical NTP hydrolase)
MTKEELMNNFNFDEFLDFIKTEDSRLMDKYKQSCTTAVLEGVAKLMEENGEFANEILIKLKMCRAEKHYENSAELAEEFADCMNVLLILANRLNIDIKTALKNKQTKINKRNANG